MKYTVRSLDEVDDKRRQDAPLCGGPGYTIGSCVQELERVSSRRPISFLLPDQRRDPDHT